jgi:integrase
MAAGIEKRGGAYRASVWSARDNKRIRRTFPTLAAAKAWRQDAQVALRRGELRAPAPTTLREAAESWLEGSRDGRISNRSGERYKPSTVRSYEWALRLRVLPELGDMRLADIRRVDLQEFVDGLRAQGLAPSTVQCTLLPLRAIFRREIARGRLGVNPTTGLELPAVRGGRERIADPDEAAALLVALPEEDRAVWATAMFAGLRRGELRALTVESIDTTANVIHVHHGWDDKEGRIETKGRTRRRVPIPKVLRKILLEHLARSGLRTGPVFDFYPRRLTERADEAWAEAALERITLHECRHTFASLMIAAGVNAKALSTYMGHANISITLDRYGHLMPGNEEEAAGLLDTYVTHATGGMR